MELLKEVPALPEEKYLTFILGSNVFRHPPPCVILISLSEGFVERSFHSVVCSKGHVLLRSGYPALSKSGFIHEISEMVFRRSNNEL